MPASQPTLHDVINFWTENPLFNDEINSTPGTKEWFEQLDAIQVNDVYLDHIDFFIPHLNPSQNLLDVGCGPGFWTRQLTKRNLNYTGVDLSAHAVELAKKGQQIYGYNGELQVGNAEELPFADSSFDYIHSIGVIHHTPNTQKCIDEFFRVLKPGGSGICGVYYKNVILRNSILLTCALGLMKLFSLGLSGRGRESMSSAATPEDLVRLYDGAANPVGKAYSKAELVQMFQKFKLEGTQLFYFPARALKIKLPKWLHSRLSFYLGLMIAIKFSKPLKSQNL